MVKALVARAFAVAKIHHVLAHTTEANAASVKVLLACGFHRAGPGAEPGSVRFEATRR
jgi:RimJ/RimL family protein N-acetyltransferase